MSAALVECVPNFSEGRRMEVVNEIVRVVKETPEVTLLDHSSDADHNRSVLTFVGTPDGVEQAAFAAIQKAAELIDMEKQEGEHPRIGATDVVPFIPISGVTMDDCVAIANRLGKRVGEELDIPVYLYEQAATRPENENLAHVRKGEYEGLKEEIRRNPDREPDYGPSELGSAGATVIGARAFLVAYNVYLDTDDVKVARKIGKAIRHSSGGLRYVKGLGMLVDGKAQVSMNLTNFAATPVYRVVEMIRREAARYGAHITHSELIGMIPQQALVDSAAWYLQLDDFSNDQVLETRISQEVAAEADSGRDAFLDSLAAPTPTPGGGSAAAQAGAMAAALAAMVAGITVGKKKYADVEAEMQRTVEKSEELREKLSASVEKDAAAFDAVMAAYKLPKGTDEEKQVRSTAIRTATVRAAELPLEVAERSVAVLNLIRFVAEHGNANAISDAGSAAALAQTGFNGAAMNVRINLAGLEDLPETGEMNARLEELKQQATGLLAAIRSAIESRGGIKGLDL